MARLPIQLSDDAIAVMRRGFAADRSAAWIAQAVLDETNEKISERTVARRAEEWGLEMERRKMARERMQDLVAAMKDGGLQASEMIQALAMERLQDDPEALTSADPLKVQRLSLASEELRLKRQQLDIRSRAVAIGEKKLAMLEAREQRLVAALQSDGEQKMTAEERIREIRGIYGLAS